LLRADDVEVAVGEALIAKLAQADLVEAAAPGRLDSPFTQLQAAGVPAARAGVLGKVARPAAVVQEVAARGPQRLQVVEDVVEPGDGVFGQQLGIQGDELLGVAGAVQPAQVLGGVLRVDVDEAAVAAALEVKAAQDAL